MENKLKLTQDKFDEILSDTDEWGNRYSIIIIDSILEDIEIPENTDLYGCSISNCIFKNIDFKNASLFDAYFKNCTFENCTFEKANIRDISFENCTFENTKFPYSEVYDENLIYEVAQKVFESPQNFDMGWWHSNVDGESCDTTHCIAGWAVELSPIGKEVEEKYGPATAGLLLLGYDAYTHFYDNNTEALKYLSQFKK